MRRNGGLSVKREIVQIDEELCDGCGRCVPACAEGAIRIVQGKAKLVSDRLCDGLGACLGHCPRGAITIQARESEPFDEAAAQRAAPHSPVNLASGAGCPSARSFGLSVSAETPGKSGSVMPPTPGRLRHWPVQLHLLPPTAPFLVGADLLVCASCVPVAMPDFHHRLLAGRAVAIACPKLDDQTGYLEKLAEMLSRAGLRSVTVARMSVPCCAGLCHLVYNAREMTGSALPITELVIEQTGYVAVPQARVQSSAKSRWSASGQRMKAT